MRLKILLLLSALICVYMAFPQKSNKGNSDNKWFIGFRLLDYTYMNARSTSNEIFRMSENNNYDVMEFYVQQWNFGADVQYVYKNGISISSGIYYSDIGLVVKPEGNNFFSSPHYFYALIAKSDTALEYAETEYIQSHRGYLTVPLNITYEPLKNLKIHPYIKAGISGSFAIGKTDFSTKTRSVAINNLDFIKANYSMPSGIFMSAYVGAGMRIGKQDAIHGMLEWSNPLPVTKKIGAFKLHSGLNFNFALYIPLFKNQ